MNESVRFIAREENGVVTAKIVIPHPSESGARKDESGNIVAAHFIKTGDVTLNGNPLLEIQLGPAVSKDPFLQFRFKGVKGDILKVSFIDSRNDRFVAETRVL